MTTTKLYTRTVVLERDGQCCVVCGSSENLSIHRIRPKAIGGKTRPENLVTLCRPCHDAVEQPIQEAINASHRCLVRQSARFRDWLIPVATWLLTGPRLTILRIRRK